MDEEGSKKNNLSHIKNWPEGDRPREMLLTKGPEALSDAALLAILLRTGREGKDAVALARDVVRLMVRLIKPREGMRIYDPCVGSGGMLILSKQHVEEHGGNTANLRLYGQDNNGGVWSMCKMNMILHGIADADIQNDDTLWNPLHLDGGELMRFDRVITNPPFSQNYSKDGMKFPERFRYGSCPETGKKADLMFLQHMLSVLRTNGMIATVMPHGVLFRGSVEKEIRRGIVEDDLLEAVIGLPPNLFYGTGIPACILVCRAKGSKPDERRNIVLFINADAEFHAGRAQNYLRPEHIEKIVSAFEAFKNIPGYAAVVTGEELKENEWNLNIRRYADNAPPPEPHDVRAHLVGGVRKAEVEAKKDLLSAHGLKPETVFVERDAAYYDFDSAVKDRGEIKRRIENGKGVQAKEKKIQQAFGKWWGKHQAHLVELPNSRRLMEVRSDLLNAFVAEITPVGLLDRFKVAGVIATWWNENQYDLKALVAQGFDGLVDGWVETIAASLEENSGNHLDELAEDPLVLRLLPDYLAELEQARKRVVDLELEKEAFEAGETEEVYGDDTGEEGERPNYAKELKEQIKEQKHTLGEYRSQVKELARGTWKERGSASKKTKGQETRAIEELEEKAKPIEAKIAELEMRLKPYEEILEKLKEAKKQLKDLQRKFLTRLNEAREFLSEEECRELVLDILKEKLAVKLDSYVAAHRQLVVAAVENWWDKYREPLAEIEDGKNAMAITVSRIFSELGYA